MMNKVVADSWNRVSKWAAKNSLEDGGTNPSRDCDLPITVRARSPAVPRTTSFYTFFTSAAAAAAGASVA